MVTKDNNHISEPNNAGITIKNAAEDRYSRLRLIPWWDQERLHQARILVVGAGALGNEVLKNLALLGVGNILIVDLDTIENSNLSRSILYRSEHEGKSKAMVAAEQVQLINPDCKTVGMSADVVTNLGLGVFRWADTVIGCLDNREARLAINQSCWKVGRPWIDGAIEALLGIVRVFVPPEGTCYECTMNEEDYRLLNQRRSCTLLSRSEMESGKVPTTPTSASIIAGVQVQEAVKLLHNRSDLPTLAGKGWFYNGITHDSYVTEYTRKDQCLSHETYEEIKQISNSVYDTRLDEILTIIRSEIGTEAIMELERELVIGLECRQCQSYQPLFRVLGTVTEEAARCPVCGSTRTPVLTHRISGGESFLDKTLDQIGIPPFDIITGKGNGRVCHFELIGDADKVLRNLDH